ncbi:hypothetical protein MNV49_001280 [Pseudohyphozyma bogoriensis]|nr:hypothetical protein MNV49_001280 [Pseudohyphozyma bogoriensis]
MAVLSTTYLPLYRLLVSLLLAIIGLALLIASASLLNYELVHTAGYNKPVPAILTASALLLIHLAWFLPPLPPPPRVGVDLFAFAAAVRLHESTPGLMSRCGGYFICKSLQTVLILSWLAFLFATILVLPLFIGTLYHHRRTKDATIWWKDFNSFNWSVYSRPTRGLGGMAGLSGHRPRGSVQLESGKL